MDGRGDANGGIGRRNGGSGGSCDERSRSYSVNAAADALCARYEHDAEETPVPVRVPRHVQIRFAAKASERAWARDAAQARAVLALGRTSVHSLRAGAGCTDMLRAGGLRYQEKQIVTDARTNRIKLLDSGAVRRKGPFGLGECLAAEPCPCGRGAQTRFHAVFACALDLFLSTP